MHTGDLAGRPVQVFSLFGGRIGQQKQLFYLNQLDYLSHEQSL